MMLLFGLTRRASRVLLAGVTSVMRLCLIFALGRETQHRLWEGIPKNPETLVNKFNLDLFTSSYVSCTKCFSLYSSSGPEHCTAKPTPSCSPCGTVLFKSPSIRGKKFCSPVCPYVHQTLKEWVGRLLSRPEIDAALDVQYVSPKDGFMYDIFDGSVLQNFKAADGTLYIDRAAAPPGTRRLVFGLGVDGFNPFGNVIAKKKASSTGIYFILFDLPPDLRYRPENMYLVGVIPGPNHPHLEQINNALQLVVDDFLPFWSPGVRFSRTAVHPEGRLVNIVIICLIMDLLAARQVAGIGFPKHSLFCSCCGLMEADIENCDPTTWPPRTTEDHIAKALQWKEAKSQEERDELAKANGARYSVLLQLPYWDPLQYTTIDSMHNHYLGLIQNHVRDLWGIDAETEDGLGIVHHKKRAERPPPAEMEEGVDLLLAGRFSKLETMRKRVLFHLCSDRDLRRASSKSRMMKELKQWVSGAFISS